MEVVVTVGLGNGHGLGSGPLCSSVTESSDPENVLCMLVGYLAAIITPHIIPPLTMPPNLHDLPQLSTPPSSPQVPTHLQNPLNHPTNQAGPLSHVTASE